MSVSENNTRKFFIDESDIEEITSDAIVTMIAGADLKMAKEDLLEIITLGNAELETPDRTYQDNTDGILREAITTAQGVYDNTEATIEEVNDQYVAVALAITNLTYTDPTTPVEPETPPVNPDPVTPEPTDPSPNPGGNTGGESGGSSTTEPTNPGGENPPPTEGENTGSTTEPTTPPTTGETTGSETTTPTTPDSGSTDTTNPTTGGTTDSGEPPIVEETGDEEQRAHS